MAKKKKQAKKPEFTGLKFADKASNGTASTSPLSEQPNEPSSNEPPAIPGEEPPAPIPQVEPPPQPAPPPNPTPTPVAEPKPPRPGTTVESVTNRAGESFEVGSRILAIAPWGARAIAQISNFYAAPSGEIWATYTPVGECPEGWQWQLGCVRVALLTKAQ